MWHVAKISCTWPWKCFKQVVQILFACHIRYCGDWIHPCLMSWELTLWIYTLTFTSKYTSATVIVNICNSQLRIATRSLWITNQWACISLKPFSTRGFSCDRRMNRRETGTPQGMPGCPTLSELVIAWSFYIKIRIGRHMHCNTGCLLVCLQVRTLITCMEFKK